MGVGYDTVDNALTGNMALQTLCIIALIKLVATAIPVGVGIPIGLIGPIMVVGACAGAAFGIIGNILLPEHASEVGLYSMLGMGAMMGATLQAPLAALMALLELTANPNIILPGMLTIIIANITTRSIFKEPSVFAVMLQHRDIKLNHAPVQQALRRAGVVQLMNENFILHQQELAHNDVDLLSKNNPDWLVISSDGKPFQLLAGTELTRYLDTTNITQDNSDNRSPSSKIPIIDLLEIPVQRLDIKAINHQATLLEAFETLQHSGFEALYVEYQVTGKISSVAGIITRKDIENFYLYSEPPTH
jgi:CIC family chloride channel protein